MQNNQEEVQLKKFMSLKLKWSVGLGAGVLVIFMIFAILLYQSFATLLLQQEKQSARSAISTTVVRLETLSNELTTTQVKKELTANIQALTDAREDERTKSLPFYSDSVFVNLSRKNIGISVYNLSGDEVFASRKAQVKFNKNNDIQSQVLKKNGHTIYVTTEKVRSKQTNQLLGYVQVTNRLTDYDTTMNKLMLVFMIFGLAAGLMTGLACYMLTNWLLRPVDHLNETIEEIKVDEDGDALAKVRVPISNQNDELTQLSLMFNSMLDQMQGYIEQQQQFVEDVSHELRTPVAIIQGHLDLLSRWGKDDSEVLEESISASLQEISRMKSLIQEMLDLSRAEQVEINFKNEETDAWELGLQVFNNFRMIHPDFTFVLDNDLKKETMVQIYRNHLEQIMIILMDNAVKYSRERKEVHVSLSRDSKYVQIAVQDFGEGISEENLKKVFSRFYRVDKARSRDKGGNGLGLAIAQRLVEGYHGKLTVDSAIEQGSVFRVTLPLVNKK